MKRRTIFSVFAVAALLALIFFWTKPTPLLPIKLPNPNGYDDLIRATQMFVGNLPECYWDRWDDDCAENVRALLESNAEALGMARLGLTRESRIPIVYSRAYFAQHLPELASLKRLAQLMIAEGKLAEMENRIDDAIQSYLGVALIHEKMRGGVTIDELVGIAIEHMGVGPLRNLADQMTVIQRREVIEKLSRLHINRDSYEDVLANEKRSIKVGSIREKFEYYGKFWQKRKTERYFLRMLNYSRTRLGLFLVDLGLRNFEAENERPPKTLQELVPEYLPFLPKDDFSGNDFVYRPSTNGYEVYGLGPDGIDDGGKPLVRKGMDSPGDMLPNAQF